MIRPILARTLRRGVLRPDRALQVLLLAAICSSYTTARAGDIGTAQVDRDSVTVGDRIAVTLDFVAPPFYRIGPVTFPFSSDTIFQLDTLTVTAVDDSTRSVKFHVALFATGRLPAVPEAMLLLGPDGDSTYILFPPESVTVFSVVSDSSDSVSIAGYKGLQVPPGIIPFWVWIVAALAIMGGAYGYWYMKQPKQETPEVVIPLSPPWEIARTELTTLMEKKYHEKGEARLFGVELSEITRRYLEGRYGFEAMEQTTSEIKRDLRATPVTEDQHRHIIGAMQGCDLAKYAKFHWPPPEMLSAHKTVCIFVDETEPVAEPTERVA
jgi:hypothetical protein